MRATMGSRGKSSIDVDAITRLARLYRQGASALTNNIPSYLIQIERELDDIAREYRDYSSVYRKTNEMQRGLNDIRRTIKTCYNLCSEMNSTLCNVRKWYEEGEEQSTRISKLSTEERQYMSELSMTDEHYISEIQGLVVDAYNQIEDEGMKSQVMQYWVLQNELDKEVLIENPLPPRYMDMVERERTKLDINEANYEATYEERRAFYEKYILLGDRVSEAVEGVSVAGTRMQEELFMEWDQKMYGHLDVTSTSIERVAYLLDTKFPEDLRNEEGYYDQVYTPQIGAARDIWLEKNGLAEEYNSLWSNKYEYLIKKLEEIQTVPEALSPEAEAMQQAIIDGTYIRSEDFAARIKDTMLFEPLSAGDAPLVLTKTVYVLSPEEKYEVTLSPELFESYATVHHYEISIPYITYEGEKYVDTHAFYEAYAAYQQERVEDGSYAGGLNEMDLEESKADDSLYSQVRTTYQEIKEKYPSLDITEEEVYQMVVAESERLTLVNEMTCDRLTSGEITRQATKTVVIAAAVIVATKNPTLGFTVLEAGSVGIALASEEYGEAAIELAGMFIGTGVLTKTAKISHKGIKAIVGSSDDVVETVDKIEDVSKIFNKANDNVNFGKKLEDVVEEAVEGATKVKPNQVHHFATNKSKKYTARFEKICNKYKLDLDDTWNKELMPHQGRHPYEYHDYMLEQMKKIDTAANGNRDEFLKLYEQLKKKVIDKPEMLTKAYWKNK